MKEGARFWLVLALLGSGACGTTMEGELLIDAGEGRTAAYAPTECVDGGHFGYFGAQLRDEDHRVLDFLRHGEEPRVMFYAPGEAAFELGPEDCAQLDGELHRETINGSDNGTVRGRLELECDAPNGWVIRGVLSFEECGWPEEEEDGDAG